ncbi:MAG TPA: response regulator [Candidatus Eremiobacteraceae bacterium]|nr:response regulator [Candidatus Eremiobacteraceae bacterium]
MRRVLLVDDEPVLRSVVRQFLEFSGYEVAEAADGRHALALARERPPEIVLTDLLMPNIDGLDFCRALRSDAATRDVPVIFVTARNADALQRAEMARLGNGFIMKPFEPDDLLKIIDEILTRA